MKRVSGFLRRARAIYAIRILEIELQGQVDALAACQDLEKYRIISVARRITQRDLLTARQRYHDMLPAGDRRTWGIA